MEARYELIMFYRHCGRSHVAAGPFSTNAEAEQARSDAEAKNATRLDEIGFSIRKSVRATHVQLVRFTALIPAANAWEMREQYNLRTGLNLDADAWHELVDVTASVRNAERERV